MYRYSLTPGAMSPTVKSYKRVCFVLFCFYLTATGIFIVMGMVFCCVFYCNLLLYEDVFSWQSLSWCNCDYHGGEVSKSITFDGSTVTWITVANLDPIHANESIYQTQNQEAQWLSG